MQVARSRNDMTPTILRMSIRDELLILLDRLLYFMQQLRTLAEQNQGKIFTGYTHCMPAQPITLDFYFLAIAEAVDRDFNRILSAYPTLNQSPLGSCALAGTSFSIDREYTASLLGFDGIIVNALDAVASRDYLLELASHFSLWVQHFHGLHRTFIPGHPQNAATSPSLMPIPVAAALCPKRKMHCLWNTSEAKHLI